MKTLLIPIDFTATTNNAIDFAIEWAKRYDYTRIILLKTFYDSLFDDIAISAEGMRVNYDYKLREREEASATQNTICRELASRLPGVKVLTATSEMPLLRAVMEVVSAEHPELILMGSDNQSYTADSYVSANLIAITKVSPVRVLIVPSTYKYQPVENVLLPCDYANLQALDKINALRKHPNWEDVHLEVLNVDPKEKHLHPDARFRALEENLHQYLSNFHFTVHYTSVKNIIDGIMHFIKAHPVQLIIAMPGRHSFLYVLTHQSISEAIYRNAQKPVLILK